MAAQDEDQPQRLLLAYIKYVEGYRAALAPGRTHAVIQLPATSRLIDISGDSQPIGDSG